MINLKCPKCSKSIKAPTNAVGKPAKCPACRHPFTISTSSAVGTDISIATSTDDHFEEFRPSNPANPALHPADDGWGGFDRVVATLPAETAPVPPPKTFDTKPRGSRYQARQNPISKFVDFEILITTFTIKIVWAIGAVLITGFAILMLLASIYNAISGDDEAVISIAESMIAVPLACLWLTFGNLLWRLLCESIIVFFKIHESLRELVVSSK